MAREKVEQTHPSPEFPRFSENVYVCPTCNTMKRTYDVDKGVTPYLLKCTNPSCPDWMRSSFYSAHNFPINYGTLPIYEWYKPSVEEINEMPPMFQEHYRNGGLKLRDKPRES